jgi:hypothetical protein
LLSVDRNPDPDLGAKKINLIPSLSKCLSYLRRSSFYDILPYRYLHKVKFHLKINLFVMAMSDQDPDPDPRWFGSLDPDPELDPH